MRPIDTFEVKSAHIEGANTLGQSVVCRVISAKWQKTDKRIATKITTLARMAAKSCATKTNF
jgi:hypothetical protein